MTSSLQPVIAWPIFAFMTAVYIVRFLCYRETKSELRVTAALGLALITCGLRQSRVEAELQQLGIEVGVTRQLSTTVIVLMMAPFILLALSWTMARQEPRWLAYVVWAAAATSTPIMLILGSDARQLNQYIDRTRGWPTIAYMSIFALFVIAAAMAALCAVSRELLRGQLSPRHRWTYVAVGVISLWATEEAASIMVSSVLAARGIGLSFIEFRIALNRTSFDLMAGTGACFASLRVWASLGVKLGLDRATRTIRRIEPMWLDLIAGCPEIPLLLTTYAPPLAFGPRRRLHRMTIEIRDSLLVLNRWVEADGLNENDNQKIDWRTKAMELQRALQAKQSGSHFINYQSVRTVGSLSLREETHDLRLLAAEWSNAKKIVALVG